MAAKKRPAKATARARTSTRATPRRPARRPAAAARPAARRGKTAPPPEQVPVDKLGKLLSAADSAVRQAAARVVGALRLGSPVIERGLSTMVAAPDAEEAAVAARAASDAGLVRLAPVLVTRVGAGEPAGSAARDALKQMGDDAVVAIQEALPKSEGSTRTQLMGLLSTMGGIRSFQLVLHELLDQDAEEARATSQTLRRSFKDLPATQRVKLLEQLRGFLGEKRVQHHANLRATTVRLMGFLGVPEALEDLAPRLAATEDRGVRMEALAAIRNALSAGTTAPGTFAAVLRTLMDTSPEVAAAALATAMHLGPDAGNVEGLKEVMARGSKDAARWAAEALGKVGSPEAKHSLLATLADALALTNPDVVHAVGRALRDVDGGPDAMVQAYLQAPLRSRPELEKALVEPTAVSTGGKALVDLSAAALTALAEGKDSAESLCSLWRRLSPAHHAGMLRSMLGRENDSRKKAVLAAELGRNPGATSDDKLVLAFQSVRQSGREQHGGSKDPNVAALAKLSAQGVDVASAMQKDPHMEPSDWLYVGFRFCEFPESKVQAQGIDLLMAARDRAGLATEVGRAAANKLRLLGEM